MTNSTMHKKILTKKITSTTRSKELKVVAKQVEKARKNPDFLAFLDERIAHYRLK